MSDSGDSLSSGPSPRSAILRQAFSITLSVAPFGIAFGVTAAEGGLSVLEAVGFSVLVFSGSAQFAAVSVLADGGTAAAAIIAGLLLTFVRSPLASSWLRLFGGRFGGGPSRRSS